MTGQYHAVVWIDHHEARVFYFDRDGVEQMVLHPDNPSAHLHHKANTIGSGHATEDQHYYERVTAALAGSTAILITGPANAKTELVKHMHRYEPRLVEHIAGVETVDHPTDKQLVAHARHYFRADHEMKPRAFQRNAPVDTEGA